MEPRAHRPRADRRARDARDRHARRVLRGHGRVPRHDRHAPAAGARRGGDGGAAVARAARARGREGQGLPLAAADRARRRGARAVRGLPRGEGRREGLGRGDVHRRAGAGGQLALGRGPVLPADRQVHGRERPRDQHRLPRAAQVDVPARRRRRRGRAGPPDLRPRRHAAALALVLRQATGARHAAGEGEHAVLARRDAGAQGRAGGLRAADLRRHGRRSHALHDRRGGRAAVGDLRAAARAAAGAAVLRAGLVGARGDGRPDRAARLAPPVRAQVEGRATGYRASPCAGARGTRS